MRVREREGRREGWQGGKVGETDTHNGVTAKLHDPDALRLEQLAQQRAQFGNAGLDLTAHQE